MRIVVASGKGGVGKSTITSSLALLFARDHDIQLLDADVDCPDLPILFKGDEVYREPVYLGKVANIDASKCTRCMLCHEKCPFGAIDEELNVDKILCEGCGLCGHVCPADAITLEPVLTGYTVKRRIDYKFGNEVVRFPLIFGELVPGSSSSGKLVDELKKLEDEKEITLVDSAAGVGCPVIASVQGADLVVLVTEPTPTALDDLVRMSDLATHFNIPQVLVINKADISPRWHNEILSFARSREIDVIGEVPFHSSAFEALSMGRPVVDFDSPLKESITSVYTKLIEVIK